MAKASTAPSMDAAKNKEAAGKPAKASNKPAKAAKSAQPNFFQRIGNYFRDVRAEMRRVVWPTRSDVINSSVVVLVTLVFFIIFTFLVDQVVVQFVNLVLKLR